MKQRKSFTYAKGKYYFVIKSIPNDIRISRLTHHEAAEAFLKYKAVNKKIEWLGKWAGKKWEENTEPTLEMLDRD